MRRRLLLIVLSLMVALVAAAALATDRLWRPIAVSVATMERDVPIQVFGLGTVEARVISRVGFEVTGTLVELAADFGDRVTAGAVLARVQSREQEARVAQARAAVDQAEAAVRQADAAIERAEASLRQRVQTNDRRQALVQRGNVSAEAADEARAAFEIAAAELSQARGAAAVAHANLEQTRAVQSLEEARLAKYELRAPYDAMVVSRNRELGSMLSPGEALFTLVDAATVWVLAYIDESKAGQMAVGQPAEVVLRSLGNRRFSGRVARIDIESDRVNEERRVFVRCEDCPADFHLGEQAEVTVSVAQLGEARLVPLAAVIGLDGHHGAVWTVEDGRLAQRDVTFGQRTLDGRLQVMDGVPQGAEVVNRLGSGFSIGRQVTVGARRP